MKKVPDYWWDFGGDGEIVVESDDSRKPIVGRFYFDDNAIVAIEQAQRLIADLNAGRVSPVSC